MECFCGDLSFRLFGGLLIVWLVCFGAYDCWFSFVDYCVIGYDMVWCGMVVIYVERLCFGWGFGVC